MRKQLLRSTQWLEENNRDDWFQLLLCQNVCELEKMVPLRPYVVTQVSIEISPKLPQVVVLQ